MYLYYPPFLTSGLANKLYLIRKCYPNVTMYNIKKQVLFKAMVQTHMNDKFKETIQNPAVLTKFMIAKTRSGMVSSLINITYPACVVV